MSKTGKVRKTAACFFPFALFGSGGTSAGAEALADAFQQMLDDNQREQRPARSNSYMQHVYFDELLLDSIDAVAHWRRDARQTCREIFDRDDCLFWLTGNHLGVLPVYDELASRDATTVIQFDAHLDVYNLSDCTEELSHGNYLLFCDGKLPRIINVGHRDLFLPPEQVRRYYQRTFAAAELAVDPKPALDCLQAEVRQATRVFIDIDCDVLDAAYFPASAQPLPFGLSTQMLLNFLHLVWTPNVAGIAISEFDPAKDEKDRSLATLLWLLEHLLLRLYEQ